MRLAPQLYGINMDNNPEECSVCFNDYDDNQLRPCNLPCGHTFCSQCIDNAIKNGQLTCPSCRAQHTATAATQFPINYGMEALIRKLKGIEVVPEKTLTAKPIKAPARGISKKLHSIVEEQKSSISSLITSCEEVLSQLGEYRGQLGDWKTHHLQLQDRLYALVEQNKSAMKLLELEDTSVVDMTTQGEEGKIQLQAMLGSLETVNTAQEVFMTINEVDQCNMEVENWLKKCQELFPDVKTVHTSVKVQETIREALEMMTTETGATVISQDIELHFKERKFVLRFIEVPQVLLLTFLNIRSKIVV
nr:tripartite motif-containing protein 59-like [Procambarus clarkii]